MLARHQDINHIRRKYTGTGGDGQLALVVVVLKDEGHWWRWNCWRSEKKNGKKRKVKKRSGIKNNLKISEIEKPCKSWRTEDISRGGRGGIARD